MPNQTQIDAQEQMVMANILLRNNHLLETYTSSKGDYSVAGRLVFNTETAKQKTGSIAHISAYNDYICSFLSDIDKNDMSTHTVVVPWPASNEREFDMRFSEEVEYLLQQLKIEDTERIFIFESEGTTEIWVVVEEAEVSLEIKYSSFLYKTLEKYPFFVCDIMVFGEDEIKDAPLPNNAVLVYSKEGA